MSDDVKLTEEVTPDPVARVRVIPPYQVVLQGAVFRPGATPEVPEHLAQQWIVNGWVEADSTKETT